MNPQQQSMIARLAQSLPSLDHGGKSAAVMAACAEIGCAKPTLYKWLAKAGWDSGRKQRSDCGSSSLTAQEGRLVAAAAHAATRKNGKRTLPMDENLELLRSNGLIKAERIDAGTGEIRQLSASAINKQLRRMALHPTQIAQPTPHVQLAYRCPNHVWYGDASVCVVFYLPSGGAQLMDEGQFYKNKPANLERIKHERVIRYVMVDAYSGTVIVRYYPGAETQANLLDFLIYCMSPRSHNGQQMPLHGLPEIFADDAGSANGSFAVGSLLEQVAIRRITHMPGNARASGSVETMQNIVETKFEHKLAFVSIADIAALNDRAELWMHKFNAVHLHSRHKMPRYSMWQTIKPNELRLAPPEHILRALPGSKIETRDADGELTIGYALGKLKSQRYDVQHVPGILVGGKVEVQVNPLECFGTGAEAVPSIRVRALETGSRDWTLCMPLLKNDAGYRVDAPMFGQEYASRTDTLADKQRKLLNELAYGTQDARHAKVMKFDKKRPAFNGQIDPFKPERDTQLPTYLPRTGTDSELDAPAVHEPPVSIVEFCQVARRDMGERYDKALYGWLAAKYANEMMPALDAERLRSRLLAGLGLEGHAAAQPSATGTDDASANVVSLASRRGA